MSQFSSKCDASVMGHAVEVLINGGLVAFPTETVYGLGADACNEMAVARIYSVKGRPADHPLIVHLPSMNYWVIGQLMCPHMPLHLLVIIGQGQ